jgi:hypothetical protein
MKRLLVLVVCLAPGLAQRPSPLLLQKPTLGKTQIAFVYAGDLWTAPRDGGEARRLTAGAGVETNPVFSPDGATIAFTGEYDGNIDVYTVPSAGGVPKRLTWHPAADTVLGWTPDGKKVLFSSARESRANFVQLYTIADVHRPDTSFGGFTNFTRYFFAQVDKSAVIVEFLTRKPLSSVATRDGEDEVQPQGGIFGPKGMLINEFAGSGGDAMPWSFRRAGAGKLIGKRTWGGLGGRAGAPQLMDGGLVTAPSSAVWDPAESRWIAENAGISPDIEVEHGPELVRQGRDPQLEKAVEQVMAELDQNPPSKLIRPKFPKYDTLR